MFSLARRTALVTGASRGLGFEIAKALAVQGARVAINGRDPAVLATRAAEIAAAGGRAEARPFDAADAAAAAAAIGEGPDILVANLGLRDRRATRDIDADAFRRLLEADLVAPYALARAAALKMQPRGWGRLILVTSIAAIRAPAGSPQCLMDDDFAASTKRRGGIR